MTQYKFTIPGKPFGKQDRGITKNGHSYVLPLTRSYMNEIKWIWRETYKNHDLLKGEISIHITAFYKLQKHGSKETRLDKLTHRTRPIIKPDCSNIAKVIEDALTGECWVDDKQVVDLIVSKFYSIDPRVEVTIEEL
jgi:Holliday junction resolvase RusA-like endonuclease